MTNVIDRLITWFIDDKNMATIANFSGKVSPRPSLNYKSGGIFKWNIPESQDYCEVNPRFNLWVGLGKALVS